MNRRNTSYGSGSLSFPLPLVTSCLVFCLLSVPGLVDAQSSSPKAGQWLSVGGGIVSGGQHSFHTTWTAAGNELFWKDDEDRQKLPPGHTTEEVSADVSVRKGQITVRGPGFLGRFLSYKGNASAVLKFPDSGNTFLTATLGAREMYKRDGEWTGEWVVMSVNDFDPSKPNSGWVPADTMMTLDVWAVSGWSDWGAWGSGYAAPKEVEYEFWFFPREGGKVISTEDPASRLEKPQPGILYYTDKDCG